MYLGEYSNSSLVSKSYTPLLKTMYLGLVIFLLEHNNSKYLITSPLGVFVEFWMYLSIVFSISNKSFDGRGNYTLGLTEQLIFSEIEYDNVVKVRGMDIVFVTTAKTNEEALDLLKGFGMPFKK